MRDSAKSECIKAKFHCIHKIPRKNSKLFRPTNAGFFINTPKKSRLPSLILTANTFTQSETAKISYINLQSSPILGYTFLIEKFPTKTPPE